MTFYIQTKHQMLDEFETWYLDCFPKLSYTGREYPAARSALECAWMATQSAKQGLIDLRGQWLIRGGELLSTGKLSPNQATKFCDLVEARYQELRVAVQKRWEYLRDNL